MAQPYPHLLSPLQCGKFIFKNRMQSSNSLPHFSQGPEKYPADPTIAHFLGPGEVRCGLCDPGRL